MHACCSSFSLCHAWSWKSYGSGLEGADREGESFLMAVSLCSSVQFNFLAALVDWFGVCGSPGLPHLGAVVGCGLPSPSPTTSSQSRVGRGLTIMRCRGRATKDAS